MTTKKQITFSLNKKLVILVITTSVLAIVLTAYLSFNFASSILFENIKDQLVEESNTRGNAVESLIDRKIRQMQDILTNPVIINSVIELSNISDKTELQLKANQKYVLISVEIRNFQLEQDTLELEDIEIIGKDGSILFSLDDPSRLLEVIKNQIDVEEPFVEFVPSEIQGQKKMKMYLPFIIQQNLELQNIGTIIVTMKTAALDKILLDRYGLQQTGEVYLVNEQRFMISDSMFIKNAVFDQKVDTMPVVQCFEKGESVSGAVYEDYRKVDIFGISYCAKEKGLVLLTEIDEREVLLSLFNLQEKIIILGLILISGVSTLVYFLSKRLSNPIIKLRDAANEISEGNFDVKTNIKSNDEIGQLSSSFDMMAKRLKESTMAINLREEIIKQQEDILLRFSQKNEKCCVCMVDIIQSTMLTSNMSDEQTRKFYGIFINSIAEIVKKFDGIVVKNIGDSVLFYFDKIEPEDVKSFKNVFECCLKICESNPEIGNKMEKEGLPKIAYRVSATYGTVSTAKMSTSSVEDIFGTTVNRCAKINRFALPNTTIIGSDVYANTKSLGEYNFRNMNVNPGAKPIYSVYLVTKK